MEEKELTAERSLEIINEQIAKNRKTVSKNVGTSLYVSGICTAVMAVVIGILNYIIGNGLGHFLWFVLPLIIWVVEKKILRKEPAAPSTLVGSLVAKTWLTFAWFVLGFFLFTIIFNFFLWRLEPIDFYQRLYISPLRIILLLMGMAVTITGYILKQRWLVWCGIIGGLGGFAWETIGLVQRLLAGWFTPSEVGRIELIIPSIDIALFSFVGLILPGYKIKK